MFLKSTPVQCPYLSESVPDPALHESSLRLAGSDKSDRVLIKAYCSLSLHLSD